METILRFTILLLAVSVAVLGTYLFVVHDEIFMCGLAWFGAVLLARAAL